MVSNPGRASDPRRVRRLKSPQAIAVETDETGRPIRLRLGSGWQEVTLIRRPWRIDQHWWRGEPVRRDYFRVAPADGPPLTVYRNRVGRGWFRQEY
jgi:hypothetical protein